ncbi:MAG: chemotaxis protein CheC [Halanaerobium sp.]
MRLDQMRKDILKEVVNIGAGNAAAAFSEMVDEEVKMTVPAVELLRLEELPAVTGDEEDFIACVMLAFEGQISGKILLVLEMDNVEKILKLIFGTEELPEEDIQHSALNELGNILSGAYLKAINTFTELELSQEVPVSAYDMAGAILSSSIIDYGQSEEYILLLETEFILAKEKIELYYFFIPEKESLGILFERLERDNGA